MTSERINTLVEEMNKLTTDKSVMKASIRAIKKNNIKNELLEEGILVEWNETKYEAREIYGYCIDNDMATSGITKEVNCSFEDAMKIAKDIIAYGKSGVRIFDKNGYVATAIEYKESDSKEKEGSYEE